MPAVKALKRSLLQLVFVPGASALLGPFRRDRVSIFMLHRFRDPERGVLGHDPERLRRALAYLRRNGYELLGLSEVFRRLADGDPPLRKAAAFTIDDGYLDHAVIAAPIFAAFDCPVTTFVTTGFLDGAVWFWWDQIEYTFRHAMRRKLEVALGNQEYRYSWSTEAERLRAQGDFTGRCKLVPESEKLAAILRLAVAAEVALPAAPPATCVPMTWDQLRTCERGGMTFGAHTVTHPVLSRTTDDQSRWELVESWRRLSSEAIAPEPVFCYPNGGSADFGSREIRVLQELGMRGAVVGDPGYAQRNTFGLDPEAPFRVRRFPYSEALEDVVQVAVGLEGLKQAVRGER